MVLKLSVVATSTCMRAGRSPRAQTIPESTDTSPDWMPWVMAGRSAARLRYGRASPSRPPITAAEPAVAKSRRRFIILVAMAISALTSGTVQTDADTVSSFQRQFRDRWITQSPQREADRHDQIDRLLRHHRRKRRQRLRALDHRQHLLVQRR